MQNLEDIQIVDIVEHGMPAVALVLAVMAYYLLQKEQKYPSPRDSILNAIKFFMVFSISLSGIGLTSEFISSNKIATHSTYPLPPGLRKNWSAPEVESQIFNDINTPFLVCFTENEGTIDKILVDYGTDPNDYGELKLNECKWYELKGQTHVSIERATDFIGKEGSANGFIHIVK